jgi:hypothetical protein
VEYRSFQTVCQNAVRKTQQVQQRVTAGASTFRRSLQPFVVGDRPSGAT